MKVEFTTFLIFVLVCLLLLSCQKRQVHLVASPQGGTEPVCTVPVADSQALSTQENTPLSLALGAEGASGYAKFSIVTNPSHGAIVGTLPNIQYLPEPLFTGTDSLTFSVSNGPACTAQGQISIKVSVASGTSTTTATSTSLSAAPTLSPGLVFHVPAMLQANVVPGSGSGEGYQMAVTGVGKDTEFDPANAPGATSINLVFNWVGTRTINVVIVDSVDQGKTICDPSDGHCTNVPMTVTVGPNPDADLSFVRALYVDLLTPISNRADPTLWREPHFYPNDEVTDFLPLSTHGSYQGVASGIYNSDESYQVRINESYHQYLSRDVDPGSVADWLCHFQPKVPQHPCGLGWQYSSLAIRFLESQEFLDKAEAQFNPTKSTDPTLRATAFVDRLYSTALGRAVGCSPTDPGCQGRITEIVNNGGVDSGTIVDNNRTRFSFPLFDMGIDNPTLQSDDGRTVSTRTYESESVVDSVDQYGGWGYNIYLWYKQFLRKPPDFWATPPSGCTGDYQWVCALGKDPAVDFRVVLPEILSSQTYRDYSNSPNHYVDKLDTP